jgi:hypothetical protein
MADVTILGRRQAAESAFTISVPQCMAGFGHVFPLSFTHFLTNKQNGNQLYQMIVTKKKKKYESPSDNTKKKKKKDITSSRRSQGDEDPKGLLIG